MTTIALREGLSFCRVGESFVFLDLKADRYFALKADQNDALDTCLATGTCPPEARVALEQAGVLDPDGQVPILTCQARPPRQTIPLSSQASWMLVLRVIVQRRRWTRALAHQPLHTCVARIQARRAALPTSAAPHAANLARLAKLGGAYRQAALIWSEYGRCLATSLALADDAIALGEPAQLVFGVQTGPFQAHCWVEARGMLVSERPDVVEPFTPILVA